MNSRWLPHKSATSIQNEQHKFNVFEIRRVISHSKSLNEQEGIITKF